MTPFEWFIAILAIATSFYSYRMMRKMQKKMAPKAEQIDGTLADEGTSFNDIAGSPHMYGNIVDKFNMNSKAIKQKSGGFLGIGAKKQTTGYRYFSSMVVVLGNCIEGLLAINFDNKGWKKPSDALRDEKIFSGLRQYFYENLYGDSEGGIKGFINIHTGNQTVADGHYAAYFEKVPAYRYLSYLVFSGFDKLISGDRPSLKNGFYMGKSPYQKDYRYWVKRTRIRNDGSSQWYEAYIKDGKTIIVCEIDSIVRRGAGSTVSPSFTFDVTQMQQAFKGNTTKVDSTTIRQITSYTPDTPIFFDGVLVGSGAVNDELSAKMIFNITSPGKYSFYLTVRAAFNPLNLFLDLIFDESIILEKDSRVVESGTQYTKWEVALYATNECNITFYAKSEKVWDGTAGLYVNDLAFLSSASNTYFKIDSYNPGDIEIVEGIDINPIHKIREIITDSTAMGKPETDVNDDNFKLAANRIWDEGLGISYAFSEKPCIDVINEILSHIEAGIRVNRQSGKYEVVLFRDDLVNPNLSFNESNIKSIEFEIANADDAINILNLNYYDRSNSKDSAFSIYDNGSIRNIGYEKAETVDFPYFMNMRNAEIVGNWKLKQLSTPCWKGSFSTGIYDARKLNRYDVVLLSWASKNIIDLPVRIMSIRLGEGRDNTVTIEFVEVVPYSSANYSNIIIDASMNESDLPKQSKFKVFEAPYYELVQQFGESQINLELSNNSEFSRIMATAAKPQSNAFQAILYSNSGMGDYNDIQKTGSFDFAPSAELDQNIDYLDTSFAVKNVQNIDDADVGTLLYLNNEMMVYVSYDADTRILTVKRGALDTMPHQHGDGLIYFFDEYFGYDVDSYINGDSVDLIVLTSTPSMMQTEYDNSDIQTVSIKSRAIRPYPPANVKINGEYYPDEIETDLILTWVDRNRLQQTGGEILGWADGGVTLEAGVTYVVELYDETDLLISSMNIGTVNTTTIDYSSVTTATCRIKLYSIRGGYKSQQAFEHTVIISFNPPYDLQGNWDVENQVVNLSWSFDA